MDEKEAAVAQLVFDHCFDQHTVSGVPYSWYRDVVPLIEEKGIEALEEVVAWYRENRPHLDDCTIIMFALSHFWEDMERDGVAQRKIKKFMKKHLDKMNA
jgi:hypothetical protein